VSVLEMEYMNELGIEYLSEKLKCTCDIELVSGLHRAVITWLFIARAPRSTVDMASIG
jgi:hypothetical protein